jgi:hypothetical protein
MDGVVADSGLHSGASIKTRNLFDWVSGAGLD